MQYKANRVPVIKSSPVTDSPCYPPPIFLRKKEKERIVTTYDLWKTAFPHHSFTTAIEAELVW